MRRPPKETAESARRISRRALMLGGLKLGVLGALGWRMRELQLEQADTFRLLAEENRINMRLLPPARGLIFDRAGRVIADNEQNYRIVMVREDAGDIDAALERLSKLVPLTDAQIEDARNELARRSPFVPVTIADRLEWHDVAEVAVNAPALPGVIAEVGLSRIYPFGEDYAHVVGYVGPVSDFDLARIDDQDPLLQIPRFQIGKNGVERRLERTLRGKAGSRRIEVNSVGRIMRELDRQEGVPGSDLRLTLDSRLQNYVQARMGGQAASAVVMDTATGELLAVGSTPAFDPNLFVRGISVADYDALLNNKYRPLASKSVQGTYPPGSTFKMVTALAALEAGVIGVEDDVWCPGHLDVANRRAHCWKRGGHGNVDLHQALVESCDVYFYEIALEVGIDAIADMARRLGLGVRHDIPMTAVAEGLSPDRAWKREVRGQEWRIGDTVNAAIGQGYVLASPLQLAVMTARLATGKAITPRLLRAVGGEETKAPEPEPLGLSETHLAYVRNAMYAVCNDRRGTAYSSRIIEDAHRMAGKTGTSQVRNISPAERAAGVIRNEDLPWERRDHALYVNYAPFEAPRIAVSVVVEHGGGGSTAAAPIARDITLFALHGDLPPLDAYPVALREQIAAEQQALKLRDLEPPSAPGRDRA